MASLQDYLGQLTDGSDGSGLGPLLEASVGGLDPAAPSGDVSLDSGSDATPPVEAPSPAAALMTPNVPVHPPTPKGRDWAGIAQEVLPAALALMSGAHVGAKGAFLQGLSAGRAHAESSRVQNELKQQQASKIGADFVRNSLDELRKLGESGADLQTFTQAADQLDHVATSLGVAKGTISGAAVYPKGAVAAKSQKAAQGRLDAIFKLHPTLKDDPAALSMQVDTPEFGRVSLSQLLSMAGTNLIDPATNAAVVPTGAADPDLGTEKDFLRRYAKDKGKKASDLTSAEVLDARKQYTEAAQKPASDRQPPQVGSFEDYVQNQIADFADTNKRAPTRKEAQSITEKARTTWAKLDDRPSSGNQQQDQANADVVADGIIAGDTAPSILEGTRGTSQGMALLASIKRKGGDSNSILRNWNATKHAIAALNTGQQLRLAENINKAAESLNKIEELNQEWSKNASRWGIKAFNRASLTLAKNGQYGKEAASVAQRLDQQIADVTGEIGQVIMGGGSPTDHALELASKNLSSDWTENVLRDAIGQVRYNLNLAQNARNEILGNLGVTSSQVQTPAPIAPAVSHTPTVNPFRK